MVYNSIKTCMALTMAYIFFEMHLALATINIIIKMHLAYNHILDVFFETQTKIHYAFQIIEILFHYNLI